jgi:hypothetical protein
LNPEVTLRWLRKNRERARIEPNWFGREILQLRTLPGELAPSDPGFAWRTSWEKDAWQCELADAVGDVIRKRQGKPTVCNHEGKNLITVVAPQGPGKTFGIAELAHWFGFCFYPSIVIVTAPKLEHVKTRFFGEFSKIRNRAIPEYRALQDPQATRVYWRSHDPENHLLVAETGKQPENMQGLRRRYTLVLVDEASGMDEIIWPVLFGNLAGAEVGILVMISNATRNIGMFAQSHLSSRLAQDYYRLPITLDKANRVSRTWVDQMIRMWGEKSPQVRIRCFGEFADSSPNQLIPLSWIQRAMNRVARETDGSLPRLRVSVDVADGGLDESVVTVTRHFQSFRRVEKVKRYSFDKSVVHKELSEVAMQLFYAWGGVKGQDDFVVDCSGPGGGTAGRLLEAGHAVVQYMGGSGSSNPAKWKNRRAQSYMNLRDEYRDDLIDFAAGCFDSEDDADEYQNQLCTIEKKPGDERLEELVPKQEMKNNGMKSPDMSDSHAMQYATQTPTLVSKAHARAPSSSVIPSRAMEGFAG